VFVGFGVKQRGGSDGDGKYSYMTAVSLLSYQRSTRIFIAIFHSTCIEDYYFGIGLYLIVSRRVRVLYMY